MMELRDLKDMTIHDVQPVSEYDTYSVVLTLPHDTPTSYPHSLVRLE